MLMLESSTHFFRSGRIPEIDANVSFRQVYEQLNKQHGAFFLVKDGQRRDFVRARLLAEHVFHEAERSLLLAPGVDNHARDQAMRDAVAAMCDRSIGAIVEDVWRKAPVLPIQQMPAGASESSLQTWTDGVFDVVNAEKHLGWFLNHETVRDATTDKTVFLCMNPRTPHKNISPDRGTCSRCPYPIGKATSES